MNPWARRGCSLPPARGEKSTKGETMTPTIFIEARSVDEAFEKFYEDDDIIIRLTAQMTTTAPLAVKSRLQRGSWLTRSELLKFFKF